MLGKTHESISCLAVVNDSLVITGGWDGKLTVWNPDRSEQEGGTIIKTLELGNKIFSLGYAPATHTLLVSMSNRKINVYDAQTLTAPGETVPTQQRESALKFMTRSIAVMADGKGWASGSIEGRIAVEYFDTSEAAQAQRYAFRCHRTAVDGVDCVYPINALAYHPM